MIIIKSKPYSKAEIKKLKEQFKIYVKTVIDVEKKICSAGMDRHFEGEKVLLEKGSNQSDIWGGGIDLETKIIDYNSFINIRPNDRNESNEIQDGKIRDMYKNMTKYFFREVL